MGRSISGLAVALAGAGGLLLYTGIKNVSIVDGLRSVFNGQKPGSSGTATGPALASTSSGLPTPAPYDPSAPVDQGGNGNGGIGDQIVSDARQYLGRPYVWAKAFDNGGGGDCSGLVDRVLWDLGFTIPRFITTDFLTWSGATTVTQDEIVPGDLVCWAQHIGIATSKTTMIHAPHTGTVVQEGNIWTTPAPVYRRVLQPKDINLPGRVKAQ